MMHERRETWPDSKLPEAEQRFLEALDEYRLSGEAASQLKVFGLSRRREELWDEGMLLRAFKLHYFEGKTWPQTAEEVKFPGNPDYLGKIVRAAYPRLLAKCLFQPRCPDTTPTHTPTNR